MKKEIDSELILGAGVRIKITPNTCKSEELAKLMLDKECLSASVSVNEGFSIEDVEKDLIDIFKCVEAEGVKKVEPKDMI